MLSHESEVEKTFVEMASFPLGDNSRDKSAGDHENMAVDDGALKNPYLRGEERAAGPIIAGKTRIGSGLVRGTIGSGGMASVYLVWNERLEVFRAVKMLSLDALYDRFETEIKISAKLRHPNIVEIYNVGEWNGMPYMEMEYIDGENLQQILNKRGRFPETVCCAAAIQIASALDYAHNLKFTLGDKTYRGIIHRDLKPANIMFSKSGDVKLTDFGIARPAQASLHTEEGNIVGTLHYLAPEQMEGKNVDHRSDIYSLGTLIYEMATGVKTFPHKSITELMRQRAANRFKRPSEHGFPINSALSDIILRCLEHDPADRYQNAEGLLLDLQKTHASLTGLAPEKVISRYYPEIEDSAPADADQTGLAQPRQSASPTQSSAQPSIRSSIETFSKTPITVTPKRAVLAAAALVSITLLSALLVVSPKPQNASPVTEPDAAREYIVAEEPPPDPKPAPKTAEAAKAAPDRQREVVKHVNPEPEPPITEPEIVNDPEPPAAESKNDNTGATAAAPPPVAPAAPKPRAPAPPPKPSESDLIKTATAAMDRRDWATAAKTLETPGAYTEKFNHRTLLLFETYVESKRLDKAQALLDTAARTGDALYFLTAGRYWYYRRNHAKAIESLEASLTRSSAFKSRNLIFDDAMYYIALTRSERFKGVPSDANRLSALDGWRRVQAAYASRPQNPRLERAAREIAELNRPVDE